MLCAEHARGWWRGTGNALFAITRWHLCYTIQSASTSFVRALRWLILGRLRVCLLRGACRTKHLIAFHLLPAAVALQRIRKLLESNSSLLVVQINNVAKGGVSSSVC